MKPSKEEFLATGIEEIREDEPMSRHTTWKVGGPADLLISPKDKEQLAKAMKIIYEKRYPWHVIGRGSNLLVRDKGIRGVVIKLGKEFNHLHIDGTKVTVGGAFSTVALATKVARHGLKGLEFAAGIPGNVGGAVYMNAGAHGSDVSKILVEAEILLETGEWVHATNEQMKFSYRTSILQNDWKGIVTEATFQLEEGDAEEITANLTQFKERRHSTQPYTSACAGSVFRNPPGDHSGRLIEAAGLKGYKIGDAQISELHANFIINCGHATAKDILALIDFARQTIRDRYQVELVPEVLVIGEE